MIAFRGVLTRLGIGTQGGRGGKFVHVDYDPPGDVPVPYIATCREIREWVQREYGLKMSNQQIAHVKRKHPEAGWYGRSLPFPEGAKPPKVPQEIEEAIEAALRHFHLI